MQHDGRKEISLQGCHFERVHAKVSFEFPPTLGKIFQYRENSMVGHILSVLFSPVYTTTFNLFWHSFYIFSNSRESIHKSFTVFVETAQTKPKEKSIIVKIE